MQSENENWQNICIKKTKIYANLITHLKAIDPKGLNKRPFSFKRGILILGPGIIPRGRRRLTVFYFFALGKGQ